MRSRPCTQAVCIALFALPSCRPTQASKDAELASCEAISATAQEAARCLVQVHRWDGRDAIKQARRHDQDVPTTTPPAEVHVSISRETELAAFPSVTLSAVNDKNVQVTLLESGADAPTLRRWGIRVRAFWLEPPWVQVFTMDEATAFAAALDSALVAHRRLPTPRGRQQVNVSAYVGDVQIASSRSDVDRFIVGSGSTFSLFDLRGLARLRDEIRAAKAYTAPQPRVGPAAAAAPIPGAPAVSREPCRSLDNDEARATLASAGFSERQVDSIVARCGRDND